MIDIQKPCESCEDSSIDKQVNLMDQFIADGGFDQAFKDVYGLPESVKQSLKEIS
ncbi:MULTISPECIES: hypothetical protein [unclassified Acinetobacter]|uniref:hypothetical protein n=1 Tax=unclassified Acinetobacter TaxID=196816 RepID=UPI000ADB9A1C|nr:MULTISPECIES: hypothetical protein [unclassified Acinetobacter]